jgi:hypothetical protein
MDLVSDLPPCGIFRTRAPIGAVPAGRLVYFHNHGTPGPGVYLPERWRQNRAVFEQRGTTLPDPVLASLLEPLLAEGLYRVTEPFTCCDKRCRTFERDLLVQLGYDGEAHPILFVPEWTDAGLAFPEVGQRLDAQRMAYLALLQVPTSEGGTGELNA